MCHYYCDGLVRCIASLEPLLGTPLTIIYPSTVFLDQPEKKFAEYMAGKGAGEVVARRLVAALPGAKLLINRLPRLRTDQTQSMIDDPLDDPLPVIVDLVRSVVV